MPLYRLSFLEAVLLLAWRLYASGKVSPPEVVVLSVKRATWPLFIPYTVVRSTLVSLRSSGRDFPDSSSVSAYCISARLCRSYYLGKHKSYSFVDTDLQNYMKMNPRRVSPDITRKGELSIKRTFCR